MLTVYRSTIRNVQSLDNIMLDNDEIQDLTRCIVKDALPANREYSHPDELTIHTHPYPSTFLRMIEKYLPVAVKKIEEQRKIEEAERAEIEKKAKEFEEQMESIKRRLQAVEQLEGGHYLVGGRPINDETDFRKLAVYVPPLLGGARRGRGRGRTQRPRRQKRYTENIPRPKLYQEGTIAKPAMFDKPIMVTLSYNTSLVTDASGNLSTRFNIRNPLRAKDGSGTYVGATDVGSMMDEYKVLKFTIQYEPLLPVGNAIGGAIVMAPDYDSPDNLNANVANVKEYGNAGVVDSRKPWVWSIKPPVLYSGQSATGSDPPFVPLIVNAPGYFDFTTPPVNGVLLLAGDGLPPNTAIGRIFLTLRIKARVRR